MDKGISLSVDIDDVLLDFVGDRWHGFIGYLGRGNNTFLERFGFDLDNPLTRNNYQGSYFARDVIGCSPDEESVLIKSFYLDDGFLNVKSEEFPEGLRPVNGAIKGIRNLVEKDYDLIANTSRPTWIEETTRKHLETY